MAVRPRNREIVPGPVSALGAVIARRRENIASGLGLRPLTQADGESGRVLPRALRPIPRSRSHEANSRSGGIVPLPDPTALVLSDILSKARRETRAPRTGEYLHVSDLLGKCIRKFALVERFGVARASQSLSIADSLMFAQGDAIHDVIKARATAGGGATVWGKWKCRCGRMTVDDPCTPLDVDMRILCDACDGPADQYVEVSMQDEEYKIVGNPDLLLYLNDLRAIHVTELKSIAPDAWKELSRPQPLHVMQVVMYWWLMQRLGYTLTDRVSVLYVTKGYLFKGEPYKEFTFDVAAELPRIEVYKRMALDYKASNEGGELPPRVLCSSETVTHAKQCEVSRICFSGHTTAPVQVSISALMRRPGAGRLPL